MARDPEESDGRPDSPTISGVTDSAGWKPIWRRPGAHQRGSISSCPRAEIAAQAKPTDLQQALGADGAVMPNVFQALFPCGLIRSAIVRGRT
jgi:hypothetical protein